MTAAAAHVKLPDRMVARTLIPGGCSCGQAWPCPAAASEDRWAALRDRLKYREEALGSLGRDGEASLLRDVLELMDRLEQDR